MDSNRVDRILDEGCRPDSWLIFYSHDISAKLGEFACTPGLLQYVLGSLRRRNMQVATMAEAVRLTGIDHDSHLRRMAEAAQVAAPSIASVHR